MKTNSSLILAALFLLYWISPCVCHSPPGQPKLKGCRSTDKETFSCWWEPGSTGELQTTYRLFYRKERSEKVFECPDYLSAGSYSCFFGKAHTSIWIIYNMTVMASNSYGNTLSEPVEVDVMDIVQPHSPGNLTVTLMGLNDIPHFLVKWEAPYDIDTRSGWVTLKYEVRVKQEHGGKKQASVCEVYRVGKQKELSIFSPKPGGNYTIQVHCKLDQGLWSEWTPPVSIHMPNTPLKDNPVLIFIAIISAFIALATAGILTIKRKHVKHFLLPPIPRPKINGFDSQLLKVKKPEDIFTTFSFKVILPAPEHPELLVLDCEDDGESTGSKADKEQEVTDHNTSHQKISNKLSITDYSEKWKFAAPEHNCQDSDPESSALTTSHHSNYFNLGVISHKNIARSSQTNCACNPKQYEVTLPPDGPMEYSEQNKKAECTQMIVIEQGGAYSRVSGIYRETVLMIQKDSSPAQRHKKRNVDDLNKKIKNEVTSSAKDSTNAQEYVTVAYGI